MVYRLRLIRKTFSVLGFYSAFPVRWDDNYVFRGESHVYWEIVFMEHGKVECVEDNKVYLVKENCMLLHAPMEFHRIRSLKGSFPRGFILSFLSDGDLPESLKQGIFQLNEDEKEEYRSICRDIQRVVEEDCEDVDTQLAADRLSAFLIRLSKKTPTDEVVRSDRSESYYKIVSDMTRCVDKNLTLNQLAQRQNVSVSYLKLLFAEYAGISPKAYYNQLRAQKAVKLLEQNRTIAEIAEQMNFSSQNYFTVFFQKHMGVSPSEYRRNKKEPD